MPGRGRRLRSDFTFFADNAFQIAAETILGAGFPGPLRPDLIESGAVKDGNLGSVPLNMNRFSGGRKEFSAVGPTVNHACGYRVFVNTFAADETGAADIAVQSCFFSTTPTM